MSTTQDDKREKEQINIFGLTSTSGRSNKYIHDADIEVDGKTFNIELKTSDLARGQVSTCRSFNLKKVRQYKQVWWVFSQYEKTQAGNSLTGTHYLAHGVDLREWFDKQEAKILSGTKTYAGLGDWYDCKSLVENLLPAETIEKLEETFRKKGCALNDPKIPWSEVERCGVKIDPSAPAEHLRQLLSERGELSG